MVQTFSSVLHMSLVGSIAILVVLAARLPLRKAPRWISFALWLVVLFRLLCPWSPSSVLSLIPDNLPDISSTAAFGLDSTPLYAAEAVVETAADMLRGQPVREIMANVGPDWMPIRLEFQDVLLLFMGWLWPLGMGILTIYHLISYMRLRLQLLKTAAVENRVYEITGLASPFVLGIFRPKIYLPAELTERERSYILLHEQTHIHRGDHLWKILAVLAVIIHWFNPLVWLGFSCFVKDMEIACDEAVIDQLGPEVRADYSASLLRMATGRKILPAFGEGDVKGRIRHILKHRQAARWLIVPAIVLVTLLILLLAVNPKADHNIFGARYSVTETLYHGSMTYSFTYTPSNAPDFLIDRNGHLFLRHNDEKWAEQGQLLPCALDVQARNALFPSSNNQVQAIMDDIVKTYKADDTNLDMHCYLFVYKPVHWHNSRLYLAMGHSEEEMRWLFELGSTTEGVDLEYLDFVIASTWSDAEDARCFAVYEDNGLLLAAWSSGTKTGISEFHVQDSSRRRTYKQVGGVADPTKDGVSCLATHALTRYAAFAARSPAQSSYEMRLDDRTIRLQPKTIPGLAVEPVPYTLMRYLSDQIAFRTAESPVGEAIPQMAVDETEIVSSDSIMNQSSTGLVYDLTENAAVSISADKLPNYQFYTNSERITVSGALVPAETTIRLRNATGQVCQEAVLTPGKKVIFSNLTAATHYSLETEFAGTGVITVTD